MVVVQKYQNLQSLLFLLVQYHNVLVAAVMLIWNLLLMSVLMYVSKVMDVTNYFSLSNPWFFHLLWSNIFFSFVNLFFYHMGNMTHRLSFVFHRKKCHQKIVMMIFTPSTWQVIYSYILKWSTFEILLLQKENVIKKSTNWKCLYTHKD